MESKANRNVGTVVSCAVELVIGVLLLINPVGFTAAIVIALGVLLAGMGIYAVVRYFRTEPFEAAQSSGLMKGLLLLVCAGVCLFRSGWLIDVFELITAFYGVVILVTGINKLQWAVDLLRLKKSGWYIALIGAALATLCAVVILMNPFASTAVLWTFIAISLIVESVVDVVAFFVGRR